MSPLYDTIPLWQPVDDAASEQTDAAVPSPPSNASRSGDALPDLMAVADAASVFGRSERTMRRWIARGWLPALSVGRSLFIRSDDVRKLIVEGMSNKTTKNQSLLSANRTVSGQHKEAATQVPACALQIIIVRTPDASLPGTGV